MPSTVSAADIPWVVAAVFAIGAGAALWLRMRDAAMSPTLGPVAPDEA